MRRNDPHHSKTASVRNMSINASADCAEIYFFKHTIQKTTNQTKM